VGSEAEAARQERAQAAGAAVDVEDLAAVVAAKVVVMPARRGDELVARRLAGEFDLRDLTLVKEHADGAIDRGDAERGEVALGEFQDLLGAERARGVSHRRADGLSLGRAARHARG